MSLNMWIKVEKYMISCKTKGVWCLKGETLIWSEHNEGRTHLGVQASLGDDSAWGRQPGQGSTTELYPQPLLNVSVFIFNLCV